MRHDSNFPEYGLYIRDDVLKPVLELVRIASGVPTFPITVAMEPRHQIEKFTSA